MQRQIVLFVQFSVFFNEACVSLSVRLRNISNEPRHEISNNVAFLTSVDSDEPVQPPFKLRNSK